MTQTIGCYVHIPFCVRKCAYCDFNSYSGYTDAHIARYVAALTQEITSAADASPISTIFFGGGTPTAIPAADQASLLKTILERLPVVHDAEITTEANPGTMDVQHLEVLRAAGFNRISFGVQSFDPGLLQTMDRIHSAQEAKNAVKAARAAGFDNVSVDLMFGLPRQTLTQWQDTLEQGLALNTEHLSLYGLIVEEGTGFYALRQKGRLPLPDDDATADMYQMAIDTTTRAGYQQYDGFGCGAVAYLDGVRQMNLKSPTKYAEAIEAGSDLTYSAETLTTKETMAETMMLGLRLTQEGVDRRRFCERFGTDPRTLYQTETDMFIQRGLLECTDSSLRLTPQGVFLASDVMMAFV
jgi:oxygen-independent coproporphyrinogen-3 oxidase